MQVYQLRSGDLFRLTRSDTDTVYELIDWIGDGWASVLRVAFMSSDQWVMCSTKQITKCSVDADCMRVEQRIAFQEVQP